MSMKFQDVLFDTGNVYVKIFFENFLSLCYPYVSHSLRVLLSFLVYSQYWRRLVSVFRYQRNTV